MPGDDETRVTWSHLGAAIMPFKWPKIIRCGEVVNVAGNSLRDIVLLLLFFTVILMRLQVEGTVV